MLKRASHRLRSFLSAPLWEKLNTLSYGYDWLKTQTWYRLAFGRVGRGTVIRRPIMLRNTRFVYLGNDVSIQAGARFDLVTERYGHTFQPRVEIADHCCFEQNFHLACAQEISIGQGVQITENVGIFDIWHPYQDLTQPIMEQPLRTAPVRIGAGAFIGFGVVIQPGVTIGKHCVVGANSVVTHSLPDYTVAVGIPARVVKHYDFSAGAWRSVT